MEQPTLLIEFYWYRKFQDGREEEEFDKYTGIPNRWLTKEDEIPSGIIEIGWRPMTNDLANKISGFGYNGMPSLSLPFVCKLQLGETPIIYRERAILKGAFCSCKICKGEFLAEEPPEKCEICGTEIDFENKISPLILKQVDWQEASYAIGIQDKFLQTISKRGMNTESM